VERITKTLAGDVGYELSHMPVDSQLRSLIALDVVNAQGTGYLYDCNTTGLGCDLNSPEDDDEIPDDDWTIPDPDPGGEVTPIDPGGGDDFDWVDIITNPPGGSGGGAVPETPPGGGDSGQTLPEPEPNPDDDLDPVPQSEPEPEPEPGPEFTREQVFVSYTTTGLTTSGCSEQAFLTNAGGTNIVPRGTAGSLYSMEVVLIGVEYAISSTAVRTKYYLNIYRGGTMVNQIVESVCGEFAPSKAQLVIIPIL
jgi:hypothetical protein